MQTCRLWRGGFGIMPQLFGQWYVLLTVTVSAQENNVIWLKRLNATWEWSWPAQGVIKAGGRVDSMFVKLSDDGEKDSHKGRFQWYMLSPLELDINHHYLSPRFMSYLYSKGQEPVPNITGSKCPHSPLTLCLVSYLIEEAILFFPLLRKLVLISCHFFHKIISWVLLSLAYSWECSPPTSLLGKMLWIPLMWVRGQFHNNHVDLPTFPFRLWAWAEVLPEWCVWEGGSSLRPHLLCFCHQLKH